MAKRILAGLGILLLLAVAYAAIGLLWAHSAIRKERATLPPAAIVLAASSDAGPIRVSYINTATQVMPRSAVLDPKADPHSDRPYVMSHPSFVLEWDDGSILLVDAGMTRAGALQFGRPIEWASGGQPIVPLGSVSEALGDARKRVTGAVFTHLHADHVGGVQEVCDGGGPIRVFMTPAQAERPNFTTRGGLQDLQNSPCLELSELPQTTLAPLPGFPGVYVIAAGGHTPGSQIIVANVKSGNQVSRIAFAGDIVNNIDGINYDIPKPKLYSLLVVPEDRPRLSELRRWLRALRDEHGVKLIVAHDQRDIEQSGIPVWNPR